LTAVCDGRLRLAVAGPAAVGRLVIGEVRRCRVGEGRQPVELGR
jgi:hypothetical protein